MKSSAALGLALTALMTLAAAPVSAQTRERAPLLTGVVKDVIFDPTTYAPAAVAWGATRLDWQSSQVLFRHGLFERNPNFTLSGRADDVAISYGAGNRQILADAFANLQLSLVNNVSARVIERLLMSRYPNHRRLVRTVGWIEGGAMASFWSYRLSAGHFRQWRENERSARQLGFD